MQRSCPICRSRFDRAGKRVFCSVPCAAEANRRRSRERSARLRREGRVPSRARPTVHTCPHCGFEFVGRPDRRWCSRTCRQQLARRRRLPLVKDNDRYTVLEIYERDGGVCQLCGEPCDRAGLEHSSPFSGTKPVIDHIVPRRAGGSDDRSNVRLAHSRCNVVLGARTYKTACKRGHPLSGPTANVAITKNGRECRRCRNIRKTDRRLHAAGGVSARAPEAGAPSSASEHALLSEAR